MGKNQGSEHKKPLLRPWLLVLGTLVGALAAGSLARWAFRDANNSALVVEWKDSFPEPAFAADASIAQIQAEADRVVRDLGDTYPDSPDALSVTARKHLMFGRSAEAVSAWRQCLRIDPDFTEALYGLGLLALDQDEYDKAVGLFGRVLMLNSTDIRVAPMLADALMKQGKISEAATLLERHVSTQPSTAAAVTMLGQAYLQLDQFEKARETFEAVLQSAPEHKNALYGLGRTYARLGDKEKATVYLQKARQIAKQSPTQSNERVSATEDRSFVRGVVAQTHVDAGRIHQSHGDLPKAEDAWRRAVVLAPDNAECWSRLLTLFEQADRPSKALHVCRQLGRIEPDNADHWLNIGVLSARLGQIDEALAAMDQAIQLDPNNPNHQEAYELIKQRQ